MEWALLLAAALACGIAVAHSYLGERYLLIRVFRREGLPKLFGSETYTKRVLRFAWHITSIAWIGLAAALFADARTVVSLTFLASAIVSFAGVARKALLVGRVPRDRGAGVAMVGRPDPRARSSRLSRPGTSGSPRRRRTP